jgi:hypothetical protein
MNAAALNFKNIHFVRVRFEFESPVLRHMEAKKIKSSSNIEYYTVASYVYLNLS